MVERAIQSQELLVRIEKILLRWLVHLSRKALNYITTRLNKNVAHLKVIFLFESFCCVHCVKD